MTAFQYSSRPQDIVFGFGSLDRLGGLVERGGWRRVLLCTSGSARKYGWLDRIANSLGDRLAATYDCVQAHVQDVQVTEALALAPGDADAVIGLGGGSPIGMAKAVAATLAAKAISEPAVIAIPTTYAGSEMTAVYGVTRSGEAGPRKVTVADPRIAPRLVIYDPVLTLDLPADLTAATGLNALAHCIEALYSVTRHPLSTAAAASGARHISRALPRCHALALQTKPDPTTALEARTDMLVGAHLAGAVLATVAMGLHHGLCHVLGGSAGVPHGLANAIILPHAMRFNLEPTAPQLALAAEAMGLSGAHGDTAAATAVAKWVADLAAQMGLPLRLRDVGVDHVDLPRLAALAFENRTVRNNPRPIREAAELEALLQEAW